jgi:hypothetical protein
MAVDGAPPEARLKMQNRGEVRAHREFAGWGCGEFAGRPLRELAGRLQPRAHLKVAFQGLGTSGMALAASTRCFCCFDEGETIACGCHCRTLVACPRCLWTLVAPAEDSTALPRAPNTRCKVCTGRYSDAAIIAGCRHARGAASALGIDTRERRAEDARMLETLLAVDDADATLELARGVHAAYEAALGAEHLTTAHFLLLLGYVLSRCERDAEAVPLFQACARAQGAMVQSWDAAPPSANDRKWMHRTLRTRLNAAVSTIFAAEAEAAGAGAAGFAREWAAGEDADARIERELTEALAGLRPLLGVAHRDVLAGGFVLADMLAERVQRQLAGAPARTRAQHALVRAARAAVENGLDSAAAAVVSSGNTPVGADLRIAWERMTLQRAALARAAGEAAQGAAGGAGGPACGAGGPGAAGGAA